MIALVLVISNANNSCFFVQCSSVRFWWGAGQSWPFRETSCCSSKNSKYAARECDRSTNVHTGGVQCVRVVLRSSAPHSAFVLAPSSNVFTCRAQCVVLIATTNCASFHQHSFQATVCPRHYSGMIQMSQHPGSPWIVSFVNLHDKSNHAARCGKLCRN